MKHRSEKAMMFFVLERINYNQDWSGIEHDLGYDLGDFRFQNPETSNKIIRLAKQNWIELQNHFNKEGN